MSPRLVNKARVRSVPVLENGSIRIPKTSEVVADHLRARIISGQLKEGDYLPPEGQLMQTLGISRPTLREALRIVEAEQLISVVRGSHAGARVHKPQIESVARYAGYVLQSEGTTVADMFEARLAIEPYVVRQLAARKSKKVIARLRAEVERLTVLANEQRFLEFIVGVSAFHQLIVDLGGNKTLHCLTRILQDLLTRAQIETFTRLSMPVEQQRRKLLGSGVRSYQKLIDLIAAGDVEGAAAHWTLHITNANRSWTAGAEGTRVVDALSRS
ncbi:MAG: FCD domain-containing protein [Steroidobacteraceae bacterium]